MPSRVVQANNVAQIVAAEIKNSVNKPTSITYDNLNGIGNRTIRIQDSFTTDGSNAVPAGGVATTVDRHRIDITMGDVVVLEEKDLAGVKCLGQMNIIADAPDPLCYISVGYKTE